MPALEQRAWEIYCEETAGDMDVRDFWEELPQVIKNHFLAKANEELNVR